MRTGSSKHLFGGGFFIISRSGTCSQSLAPINENNNEIIGNMNSFFLLFLAFALHVLVRYVDCCAGLLRFWDIVLSSWVGTDCADECKWAIVYSENSGDLSLRFLWWDCFHSVLGNILSLFSWLRRVIADWFSGCYISFGAAVCIWYRDWRALMAFICDILEVPDMDSSV